MKLSELSEKQLAMIDPLDRQRLEIRLLSEQLAEAQRAAEEPSAPEQPTERSGLYVSEKDEHEDFINWCRRHDLPCRHDRTDKPTTGNVGWPDFEVVYRGRILPLEFKVHRRKLTLKQREVHEHLARTGTDVLVCYSADEAIRKTMGWLWEHWRWTPVQDA